MGKLPVSTGALLVMVAMAGAIAVSWSSSRALPDRPLCGPDERLLIEQPAPGPAPASAPASTEVREPGGLEQQFVCVDRRGMRRRAGWS